jgi:hypothetical protein
VLALTVDIAASKPASFHALLVCLGERMETLDIVSDLMLRIRPGFSDPKLLQGGSLRPMVHAMAATLIMYYTESTNAGEIVLVTQHMRISMQQAGVVPNVLAAGVKLDVWSAAIKKQFRLCNLHLTSRAKDGEFRGCFNTLSASIPSLLEYSHCWNTVCDWILSVIW